MGNPGVTDLTDNNGSDGSNAAAGRDCLRGVPLPSKKRFLLSFGNDATAALFTLFVIAAAPARVLSQDLAGDEAACVAAIPQLAFYRVPVVLNATVANQESIAILPSADFLTQAIALSVRSMLGSPDGELPAGDSVIGWRNVWGTIAVTGTPDGRFTWKIPSSSERAAVDSTSALAIVERALKKVAESGELLMWPQDLKRDSVTFNITIHRPLVRQTGVVSPVAVRQAFPMFTLRMPWESPVDIRKGPRIVYPERSRKGGAIGVVRMQFVVNRHGRLEPGTVMEVWPDGVPQPDADVLPFYKAFVAAVRRGLPTAEFHPAMIGGCAMKQLVIESFEFQFR